MKIKILRATVVGGQDVSRGDTPDVSERDARILISMGKAELVGDGQTESRNEDEEYEAEVRADYEELTGKKPGNKKLDTLLAEIDEAKDSAE